MIAPQCPAGKNWRDVDADLFSILDAIADDYDIDASRIYLTGVSLGGGGTWHLAAQQPDLFAAIAPLCGYGNPLLAEKYENLPIWVFHGAKDRAVPVDISDKMNAAVKNIGGNIRYTRFADRGHNIVQIVYSDPDLYEWFLKHKK